MKTELIQATSGAAPPPGLQQAYEDPVGLLTRVADAVHTYWSLVIAPHWPRMQAVLRADILHRAQRLAAGGAAAPFPGIDPGCAGGPAPSPWTPSCGVGRIPHLRPSVNGPAGSSTAADGPRSLGASGCAPA
ncbi:hypothetical protein [Streptomyces sp. NPDC005970]|uniref:hypothetical protein n=1 Tax=Streptomyces sp. NPDC005970 TaxID=3156723 RepID=UPI0033C7DD8B